jgi:hypothetical protein
MAVKNGSDLFVFIDGVRVAHSTSHSLSMKMATRDTSNKDTGKFNTKGVGRMDITASSDALKVDTDFATLGAAYLAREVVHLAFGEQSGAVLTDGELLGGTLDETKFYAEGNFIITGLDENAADQQNASYTVSFENADGSFEFSTSGDLRVGALKTNCTENAADDGFAACFPKGGTAPYTFSWNTTPAQTTQSIVDLEPGTYTVTVTDSATPTPATAAATVTITEPEA